MVLLLGKCCLCSPSFIGLNRLKSEGAKSTLYSRCGLDNPAKISSVLHCLQTDMGPRVIMLQEKGCLLFLPDSRSLSLQLGQCCNAVVRIDGLPRVLENSEGSTPFLSQNTVHITVPAEGYVLNFFFMGNLCVANPWTTDLILAHSADITFHHWWWCDPGNYHLQPCIGSVGPNKLAYLFVPVIICKIQLAQMIFQHCHHHLQHIEESVQLHTQFPDFNQFICSHELVETFFTSWCDSREWPTGTWLVLHVTVTAAERYHCDNIHCLVSINIQQTSMNVNGYNFFCMEELNYTHCFTHTFMSAAILSDCPSTAICSMVTKCNVELLGRFNLYCHINDLHLQCQGPIL